jgi:hypothetical protein
MRKRVRHQSPVGRGGPAIADWNAAFDEVCSRRLDVAVKMGRVVGLDEVATALDDARDANGPPRIAVVP